jgi:hypothetical protein
MVPGGRFEIATRMLGVHAIRALLDSPAKAAEFSSPAARKPINSASRWPIDSTRELQPAVLCRASQMHNGAFISIHDCFVGF